MAAALHVGITGSRNGADQGQLGILSDRLSLLCITAGATVERYFHHGDCVGVDDQAHVLAIGLNYRIYVHPPTNRTLRAYVNRTPLWNPAHDLVWPPKPYLERNLDIINAVSLLFVVPDGPERPRSGTWSTYRAAIRLGVTTVLIPPTET
jgi:hypothetical protein